MPIKLNGETGGSVSFDAPDNTSPSGTDVTLTLPTSAGNADQVLVTNGSGTLSWESRMTAAGPAFSAYQSSSATISNATFTKIAFDTEDFDTNSDYDNTTNYRFTPTVEGYYQISASMHAFASSSMSRTILTFRKNGTETERLFDEYQSSGSAGRNVSISRLFYMNGTTDYLETYIYLQGSGTLTLGGSNVDDRCIFTGALVRPA